jgi:hypothetical protein
MDVNVDLVKAGMLADAIEQTASLAKYPNVSVKLSATRPESEGRPSRRDYVAERHLRSPHRGKTDGHSDKFVGSEKKGLGA